MREGCNISLRGSLEPGIRFLLNDDALKSSARSFIIIPAHN